MCHQISFSLILWQMFTFFKYWIKEMDTKAKAFITEWPEKSHKSYLDLISTTTQQILNDSALSS